MRSLLARQSAREYHNGSSDVSGVTAMLKVFPLKEARTGRMSLSGLTKRSRLTQARDRVKTVIEGDRCKQARTSLVVSTTSMC